MGEIQRFRLLTAMREVACARGAANVTVADVVEHAGISRRTFYEQFADREACLLAALEHALACARSRVAASHDPAAPWRQRVRAGLEALLSFLEDEPLMGRLLVVESLWAGSEALARRSLVLAPIVREIDSARSEARGGGKLSSLTAEALVGGTLSILSVRLVEGSRESLSGLLNPLMAMIVLPYLGTAAARREMSRALPSRRRNGAARPTLDPLRKLPMRLTYRTTRVLTAICEQPGASNRAIAEAAGIQDQGQISKLLRRLKQLGLIENATDGAARGQPNAWKLTPVGRQLHAASIARR